MFARLSSCSMMGIDAFPVEVEVHITGGLSRVFIVGLPDTAVKEAYQRVKAAIRNSEFPFPPMVITVNLAPAHLRKEGSNFDLPIALGILAADGLLPKDNLESFMIAGELALNGGVRKVRGALVMALCARRAGKRGIILPWQNAAEASLVSGIKVIGVRDLREAVAFLKGEVEPAPVECNGAPELTAEKPCMSEVKGQAQAKRAMEVAAAGGHNLLMIGPPGSGKTMLAQRLPTLLPPLNEEEALEVTKIHSVVGLLKEGRPLIEDRPFRAPHHSISHIGLVGGGSPTPRPGEITLSHHGVLFLDELPEFRRDALEVLRQPLEEGKVTITRSLVTVTFPARFQLVASMNPCPCGYWGDLSHTCNCSPGSIRRYFSKISGPLLDRIDLQIEVPRLQPHELKGLKEGETSEKIKERVLVARELQERRLGRKGAFNAHMTPRQLRRFCALNEEGENFLLRAVESLGLTARGYDRCLRIARTIADLARREKISLADLAEAVQYRSYDRLNAPLLI
jgi:magnesium chelatase family protein